MDTAAVRWRLVGHWTWAMIHGGDNSDCAGEWLPARGTCETYEEWMIAIGKYVAQNLEPDRSGCHILATMLACVYDRREQLPRLRQLYREGKYRGISALALGYFGDAELIDELCEDAHEPITTDDVMTALGLIAQHFEPGDAPWDKVAHLLESNDLDPIYRLRALARLRAPSKRPFWRETSLNGDPDEQRIALFAVARGQWREFIPDIVPFASCKNPLQSDALLVLGALKGKEAMRQVVPLVLRQRDFDPVVLVVAIGMAGPRHFAPELRTGFKPKYAIDVQVACALGLALIGDDSDYERIHDVFTNTAGEGLDPLAALRLDPLIDDFVVSYRRSALSAWKVMRTTDNR